MKVSGCIITKNEEKNIAKCIDTLANVTDEIIVVDTGSDDKTVKIAKNHGAFVYDYKWENDFAKAKNTALRYAKGDWIIFLDADEYFDDDSLRNVRQAIQQAHPSRIIEGLYCNVVNIEKDSGQVIGNNLGLRIFRNDKEISYINKIHEEIRHNGAELKCFNRRNEISIIHTGYSSSLIASKARRNLELLLDNMDEPRTPYYLAVSYNVLSDHEKACKYAEIVLKDGLLKNNSLAYQMHLIKINSLLALGNSDNALIQKTIDEAKQEYKDHPEIARAEATYLLMEKRYSQALETYQHALDCQEQYAKDLLYNLFPSIVHEVYFSIGSLLFLLNRELDALDYYVKALKTKRYYPNAFRQLLFLFRTIPDNDVIAFINSIYNINKEQDIQFIIAQAADCGRAEFVLYYVNLWNNVFGHEDDALIYAFLSQQRYDKAFEIALLYLKTDKSYAPLITCVILMGSLFTDAESIKSDLGQEYYDIIRCFVENRKCTGNNEAYITVLPLLIKFADPHVIQVYLNICMAGAGMEMNIAESFLSNYQFENAVQYYAAEFSQNTMDEKKALAAFKSGFCYYKLKRYSDCLDWFEKAIKYRYVKNDLFEFLHVVAGQCNGSETANKADVLLKSIPR